MRNWILAASAAGIVVLAGCSNQADDTILAAKQRYVLVKRHGSKQEICNAAREIERAYLNANDEEGYSWQKLHADVDCNAALLDSR